MNDRDLEHHARTVTELQRELMFPSEDGSDPETLLVAGHLEFVTLTNDGISTKILHRWPDVIGEKMVRQSIGRDGGPAAMLSQQRRRPACQDTIAGSSRPSSGKSQR
jgi:hypothetical protein